MTKLDCSGGSLVNKKWGGLLVVVLEWRQELSGCEFVEEKGVLFLIFIIIIIMCHFFICNIATSAMFEPHGQHLGLL